MSDCNQLSHPSPPSKKARQELSDNASMSMAPSITDDYERRSGTIHMEDITTDEVNQEILRQLRDNDPNLKELWLYDRRWSREPDDDTSVGKYDAANDNDAGWLGYFIGKTTHLRELHLVHEYSQKDIPEFCRGVIRNRSLQKLFFHGPQVATRARDMFEMLTPLFTNGNLTSVGVENAWFYCGTFLKLSMAIESCNKSLKHIKLRGGNFLANEDLVLLLNALKGHCQLETMELTQLHSIRWEKICGELALLLRTSLPNLGKLNLSYSCFNDECIKILVGIVRQKNSLTVLNLSGCSNREGGVTETGWRSLANLIRDNDCNLEELLLCRNEIDDEIALLFANAVATNRKIKTLALTGNCISVDGWSAFSRVIRGAYHLEDLWFVNLKNFGNGNVSAAVSSLLPSPDDDVYTLKLSHNHLIDDGYATDDGTADDLLDNILNDRLFELDLSNNILITQRMWQSFESLMGNNCTSLEHLYLGGCNINDDMIIGLVNALQRSRISLLDLSKNHAVTVRGWRCVASLLENSDHLDNLCLDHNAIISDEEASLYSNVLAHNDRLSTLSLRGSSITAAGWSAFLRILCDTSSINKTFQSNHSLCDLGLEVDDDLSSDGEREQFLLEQVLALNKSCTRETGGYVSNGDYDDDEDFGFGYDKSHIAMMKILNHHHHFEMSPFFEWGFKMLPIAINWFNRATSFELDDKDDDRYFIFHPGSSEKAIDYELPWCGCSLPYHIRVDREKLYAIYQFIHSMPNVFEPTAIKRRKLRKYYYGTKYRMQLENGSWE